MQKKLKGQIEGQSIMTTGSAATQSFYDQNYPKPNAQRHYPNEELLRFCGRTLFVLTAEQRRNTHVLELGCGNGANIWMLAREGFQVHGIDLSKEAIHQAREKLASWGTSGDIREGDMTQLVYEDESMDAVIDVFSASCLVEADFAKCLSEVRRVLKPGGKFFSFEPSKNSDAFVDYKPARKLDASTLEKVVRKGSAYEGLAHPLRFHYPLEYQALLEEKGFAVTHMEKIGRTYSYMTEYFEFLSTVAEKQ